ncbi:MAG: PAS domain-containing protein, partial [Alphaproteobacteria bacterium]
MSASLSWSWPRPMRARGAATGGARGGGNLRALAPLFAPEGPLGRFPGPAFCLDREGAILCANEKAYDLAQAVAGGNEGLVRALARAFEDGEASSAMAAPPATRGTWSVTFVPLGGESGGAAELVLVLGRDASLERNLRVALADSRQRYKDLVEISSDFAWETGPDGRFAFVSPRGALGFRADELVGRDPRDLLADREKDDVTNSFQTKIAREDVTVWARRADAAVACLLTSCRPIASEDGAWRGARGVCRDVTEARERDAALA